MLKYISYSLLCINGSFLSFFLSVQKMADATSVAENLELQLSELEMLQAMFPADGELILDDVALVDDIRQWIDKNTGSTEQLPSALSYNLKLSVSDEHSIDVHCSYPHDYPSSETLEVYVRSNTLSRKAQTQLNSDLQTELKNISENCELSAGSIVAWLQEKAIGYFQDKTPEKSKLSKKSAPTATSNQFVRLWMYSHHIYSMVKRKNILDLAREYSLTGFCMPGKPGIICFEGPLSDCNEVWCIVKSWNWKKICCQGKYLRFSEWSSHFTSTL